MSKWLQLSSLKGLLISKDYIIPLVFKEVLAEISGLMWFKVLMLMFTVQIMIHFICNT